ncbi:hypothetical protein SHKM778_78150 [Streptomyces sp. KM77-8]|uniref:Protein kinase domain-containing protein n=1 Tax=Streptomyces haneummycinicus TaxID=3074435 RepID=A0AAT9HV89_9ACTN
MTEKAIGEFSRLRPVGEGPLGYTYRGIAPDGSFWAVKELHPDWGPPRETWQRVEEVLWRFRQLRESPNRTVHRHTVSTVGGYDHGTDRAWVATRWLGADTVTEGSHPPPPAVSLAHALASGPPLPPGAALYLMWQLSNLARQLDTLGLTLAGLKPSNLFLTADGVVVVDLHLALRLRSLLRGTAPASAVPVGRRGMAGAGTPPGGRHPAARVQHLRAGRGQRLRLHRRTPSPPTTSSTP